MFSDKSKVALIFPHFVNFKDVQFSTHVTTKIHLYTLSLFYEKLKTYVTAASLMHFWRPMTIKLISQR